MMQHAWLDHPIHSDLEDIQIISFGKHARRQGVLLVSCIRNDEHTTTWTDHSRLVPRWRKVDGEIGLCNSFTHSKMYSVGDFKLSWRSVVCFYFMPENPCFFRYQEHWRNMTQRYCFLIALTVWLESGILATHDTVAQVLGSKWIIITTH